jgi:hypothetical protein
MSCSIMGQVGGRQPKATRANQLGVQSKADHYWKLTTAMTDSPDEIDVNELPEICCHLLPVEPGDDIEGDVDNAADVAFAQIPEGSNESLRKALAGLLTR